MDYTIHGKIINVETFITRFNEIKGTTFDIGVIFTNVEQCIHKLCFSKLLL
jgi:hypothetical protein